VLALVVILVVWEVAAGARANVMLPTFTASTRALIELTVIDGALWGPFWTSNQALVLGYIASVVVGVPLGLATARSQLLERGFTPWIAILLALPIAPLMPVVISALGPTLAARTLIVFLFAFVYIAVNTRAGVRNVDPVLIEMARSFGANEAQIWRRILLPGAVPAVFAGLRIGLGRAIAGMIVVELLLSASGIGLLLLSYSGSYRGDQVFALVMAIMIQAALLVSAMRILERRVAPWSAGSEVRD
jgi:NitT/TauT family transport system permease protein